MDSKLFTLLALLSVLSLVAAASKAVDTLTYDYLVFPTGCLEKFLAGDILNEFCLKKTISKLLGYGIIAGASIPSPSTRAEQRLYLCSED